MLIVLSPAKSLDLATPPTTKLHSIPDFLDRSHQLIEILRGYSPQALCALMDLSDQLAALNVGRYASWTPELSEARQAIMTFNGDVYGGFDARTLKPRQLAYTQHSVRILSGLYGVLRPLDLIHPHRLEMGTRLATPAGKDLYAFWGDTVTGALNGAIAANDAKVLLNLASAEYFKSVKPHLLDVPVITPVFQEYRDGKYQIMSLFAKRARGQMARYAAVKGISDPSKLKRFDVDGYRFDKAASSEYTWYFRRGQLA